MVLRRLKHRCAGLTTRTPQALARVLQPGRTAPERQLLRRSFCLGGAADRGQTAERASFPQTDMKPARLRRVVLATLSRVVASRVVAELRGGPVAD